MFCGKSGNKGDGPATQQNLEDFVIVADKIFTILDVRDRSEWNRRRFITGLGGKLCNVIFLFCFHFALIPLAIMFTKFYASYFRWLVLQDQFAIVH